MSSGGHHVGAGSCHTLAIFLPESEASEVEVLIFTSPAVMMRHDKPATGESPQVLSSAPIGVIMEVAALPCR